MTQKFFNLTGRAAVLAALLLGLFLAAGTATAQDQSSGAATGTPEAAHRQTELLLRIMVFAHAPVTGADVRVSVHGLPLVHVHAATNQYGVFTVAVRSHPSLLLCRFVQGCRVSISGGTVNGNPFPWHLMADLPIADLANEILVVNPVTTLVSRLLDARPELDLNEAQARVRSFLTLPANYPLGQALRQGRHYSCPFFSPAVFMAEAEAAGGLDAFAHLLLQELALGLTHSFRPPPVLTSTTSDPLGTAATVIQAGLSAGLLDWAAANNVANLAGWAMSLAGLPSGNSEDISNLESELGDIVSSIQNLSYEVGQLNNLVRSTATQTQYNSITNFANQYAVPIQKHESDLEYYSKACPPLVAGSTPATDSTCTSLYNSLYSELQIEDQNAYYELVQNYVQDNGTLGTSGILHLYSLWLGQSKRFFRAADSAHMQNLYDYWDSILTSAANLRVEYYHIQNYQTDAAGMGKLTGFMAPSGQTQVCMVTPTQPVIIGAFQCNETANLKLMFPAVPDGTVINTTDRLMWALVPWTGFYPFVPAPQCQGYGTNSLGPSYALSPYAGFNDWAQSPSKTDWQNAVQNASINTATPNWLSWLIQQTQTTSSEMPASPGFFNWSTCSGLTHPYAWTSTLQGVSNGKNVWWYINPINDNFGSTTTGSIFVNMPVRGLAAGEQYYWYQ